MHKVITGDDDFMKDNDTISLIPKVLDSIPANAWTRLVDSICSIFERLISPVVETTSGAGRVIKAHFDRLLEAEKIVVAQTMSQTLSKIGLMGDEQPGKIKPKLLIECIKAVESQTDPTIQELWANLLAQESVNGNIHPITTEILGKMCAADAQLLASIATMQKKDTKLKLILKLFAATVGKSTNLEVEKLSFSYFKLEELKLITRIEKKKIWLLTQEGWLFIRSVTDPVLQARAVEQPVGD